MKSSRQNCNILKIDADTSDIILTPLACASIVNEIIKGLLYQKCQIPYSYSRMKIIVTKKRENTSERTTQHAGYHFLAESHFITVSKAFDTVESAMTNITNEFTNYKNKVKSVVFILGTTPYTAREVITINVSPLIGHNEINHAEDLNKYQQKILRSIFLRQDWLDKLETNIPSTNVYIYITKTDDYYHAPGTSGSPPSSTTNFLLSPTPSFPKNTKFVQISLKSDMRKDRNCCEHLKVFEDTCENIEKEIENNSEEEEDVETITWYKYKDLVKGFKNHIINKKPLYELW